MMLALDHPYKIHKWSYFAANCISIAILVRFHAGTLDSSHRSFYTDDPSSSNAVEEDMNLQPALVVFSGGTAFNNLAGSHQYQGQIVHGFSQAGAAFSTIGEAAMTILLLLFRKRQKLAVSTNI